MLNRHDIILKDMVSKYELNLDHVKVVLFDPSDETLIDAILTFSRFILDNSLNKSIFSSEKHVATFLHTVSPKLVAGALKVMATLVVYRGHSRAFRYLTGLKTNAVIKYATFLLTIRDGTSRSVSDKALVEYLNNSSPARDYTIQYYLRANRPAPNVALAQSSRTTRPEITASTYINAPTSIKNHTTTTFANEGLSGYMISAQEAIEQPLHVYLSKVFEVVPEEFRLDAVLKTFIAKSTAPTEEGAKLRSALLEMQCNALVITGYISTYDTLENILSDFPCMNRQLCLLILPQGTTCTSLRVAVIRSFCNLSAGPVVGPGIAETFASRSSNNPLFIILRNIIADLKHGQDVDQIFISILTSFIFKLFGTASSGTVTRSASEMIPLLIELVKLGSEVPMARCSAIETLMNIVSGSQTNLTMFLQQEKGSSLLISFYQKAIDSAMFNVSSESSPKYCHVDYSRSYYEIQWLKNVLHMISSIATHSRTSDRIQTLLESPFISLTTQVVKHPDIFGSRIIILALSIIGSLLENESSTFAAMSESGHLSEILTYIPILLEYSTAFYSPMAKFLSSIAHNELGMSMVKEKELFQVYFKHIRPRVNEKDGLKHLGASLDQICSEHDGLRPIIIGESIKLIEHLREALNKHAHPAHYLYQTEHICRDDPTEEELIVSRRISLFASSMFFVDNMLKNHFSGVEFIKQKGLASLLSFFEIDSMPYDITYNPSVTTLSLTIKQLFDLDIDCDYLSKEMLDKLEAAICHVEIAQGKIEVESECDLLAVSRYQDYLRSLLFLNNMLFVIYTVVFTNYGTGYHINAFLNLFGAKEIEKCMKLETLDDTTISSQTCENERNIIFRLGRIQRQAFWEEARISRHISPEVRAATRQISLEHFYRSQFKRVQDTDHFKKLRELEKDLKGEETTPFFKLVKAGRFLLNGATCSISKFYSDIASHIYQDIQEEVNGKHAYKLIDSISQALVDHLDRYEDKKPSEIRIHYLLDAILSVQKVMYVTSQGMNLNKGVFIFFKQKRGVIRMLSILDSLLLTSMADDADSITAGIIEVILVLTSYMVSPNSGVSKNSYKGRIWGQQEHIRRPNYFLRDAFFLQCELSVFDTAVKIWKSDILASKSILIRNLVAHLITSIFFLAKDEPVKNMAFYLDWREVWPSKTVFECMIKQNPADQVLKAFKDAGFDESKLFENLEPIDLDEIKYPTIPVSVLEADSGSLTSMEKLIRQRSDILENALDDSLKFLHDHPENVFVIAELISKMIPSQATAKSDPSYELKTSTQKVLIETIRSIDATSETSRKPLAAFCHLLGLLLHDRNTLYHYLEDIIASLPVFAGLLEVPNAVEMGWFPQVLLVLETVYAVRDVPEELVDVTSKLPITKVSPSIPKTNPIPAALTSRIFSTLINIDKLGDGSSTLAIARLFVYFTRDFNLAAIFMKSSVLPKLLRAVKELSVNTSVPIFTQLRSAIVMILRNLVETPAIVLGIMKTAIKEQLASKPVSSMEDFLSIHSLLIARSSESFLDAVDELCTISEPSNAGSIGICLKSTYKALHAGLIQRFNELKDEIETETPKIDSDGDSIMKKMPTLHELLETKDEDTPASNWPQPTKDIESLTTVASGESNGVIHLLITELMSLTREDIFSVPEKTEDAINQYLLDNPNKTESQNGKPSPSKPGFHYASFLLLCLNELLGSYTTCKLDFINHSNVALSSRSHGDVNSTHTATILDHLLLDLMPVGILREIRSVPYTEWNEISFCATAAILKLASSPDRKVSPIDAEGDVQNDSGLETVRICVIDSISRAFKMVEKSCNNLDWQCSILVVLSDLLDSLVISPPSIFGYTSSGMTARDANAVGKIAIEKDIPTILTDTLSDIDLNHPEAVLLIRSLTKTLSKISRLRIEVMDDSGTRVENSEAAVKAYISGDGSIANELDISTAGSIRTSGPDTDVNQNSENEQDDGRLSRAHTTTPQSGYHNGTNGIIGLGEGLRRVNVDDQVTNVSMKTNSYYEMLMKID